MNAICLVVDGLHIGYLGAYGNDWAATPELDRLACQGFVWDQATIESPELPHFYRACWQGLHALAPVAAETNRSTLAQLLSEADVETALLSDDPDVANLPAAVDFDEVIRLPDPGPPRLAKEVADSRFAELFAEAADWITTARQPFLLWVHARGMSGAWDAPLALRNQFADDESLSALDAARPPQRTLPRGFNPDELLPIRWAYAGQVALLDQCLGGLLECLKAAALEDSTLLAVLSPRGYPLGEHLRVGPCEPGARGATLYTELIHVPWLMRFPVRLGSGGLGSGGRSQALVQPCDLAATLLDCFQLDPAPLAGWGQSLLPLVRGDAETVRDRACASAAGGERSIRTPAWRLRWSPQQEATGAETTELFVKPDDFWEFNDVADRCADLVQPLQAAFRGTEQHLLASVAALPPLEESLLIGPE